MNNENSHKTNNIIFFFTSIRTKIFLIVIILLLFTFFMLLISVWFSKTLSMVTHIARAERTHSVTLNEAQYALYEYLTSDEEEKLNEFWNKINKAHRMSTLFSNIVEIVTTSSKKNAVLLIDKEFDEFNLNYSKILINRMKLLSWNSIIKLFIDTAKKASNLTDDFKKKVKKYENNNLDKQYLLKDLSEFKNKISVIEKEFSNGCNELANFSVFLVIISSWIFFILISILGCFFSYLIGRKIINPVKYLASSLHTLSNKDLTVSLKVKSNDEFGRLEKNFNDFLNLLIILVKKIKNSVKDSKKTNELLSSISKISSDAIKEISGNTSNIAIKTNTLTNDISQSAEFQKKINEFMLNLFNKIDLQFNDINASSAAIEQMNNSIQNIDNLIETKIPIVEKLQNLAAEGEKEMKDTIEVIQKITDSTSIIMNLLNVIKNISNQTNLLAMNAAIEAAHAGNAGHGFTVVANEIRTLAENTGINAKQISISLKEIINYIHISQQSSSKTGEHFKNIVLEISDIVKIMLEIKNFIKELLSTSNRILNSLVSLKDSGDNVSNSTKEIRIQTDDLQSAFENINQFANETKLGIDEINIGITEISKSFQLITETGEKNTKDINKIEELIDNFKI